MKICKEHWQICRDAISDRGMDVLVSADGEEAMERTVDELQGGKPKLDPLLSMNNHWWSSALQAGGLYLMGIDEEANPDNDGHFCPICEFAKHSEGFEAKSAIGTIADQMQAHCYDERLISRPS